MRIFYFYSRYWLMFLGDRIMRALLFWSFWVLGSFYYYYYSSSNISNFSPWQISTHFMISSYTLCTIELLKFITYFLFSLVISSDIAYKTIPALYFLDLLTKYCCISIAIFFFLFVKNIIFLLFSNLRWKVDQ